MSRYPHLFSAGRIGTLELKNRILQTAMGTNLANTDGTVNDQIIAFYAARAAGGAAMMTMGACGVAYPRGQVQTGQVGFSDDRFLDGLRQLTNAVHENGGRVCAQIHHGGTSSLFDMVSGNPVIVPSMPLLAASGGSKSLKDFMFSDELSHSPLPSISSPPQFKEATQEDIDWLIDCFAQGAVRAVAAGFDAIELHAGHSYIINSFLSPAENRRSDRYGGSREKRAQLMKEIIEAIRRRIGPDFPLLVKLNSREHHIDNGLTLEDGIYNAQVAEAAGADAITVSANHNYAVPRALFSSWLPHDPGKLLPAAEAIKRAVSVPVITVGRIEPDAAERAIGDGQLDFMAMGRKQIADDAFANHLASGGAGAVRPCIYCYQCVSQAMMHLPLRCAVNGETGFESANLLAPALERKQVVVVGGGPGGMEAAQRLAQRGHDVTLLEAGDQLGGTARIAAIAYPPNGLFVEWLKEQLQQLGVTVRLNTTASPELIATLAPSAVVVATGALRQSPPIPGKDQPHVHDGASLRALLLGENPELVEGKSTAVQRLAMSAARKLGVTGNSELVRRASKLWMPIGNRVVIIGGDLVGLELAEFLHERGRTVAVIDEPLQMGRGLSPARRSVMLDQMPLDGIELHTGVSDIRIEATAVHFLSQQQESMELAADTVIIAKGARPNTQLYDDLLAAGVNVYRVGDCVEIGYIMGAVRTAADVAAVI